MGERGEGKRRWGVRLVEWDWGNEVWGKGEGRRK